MPRLCSRLALTAVVVMSLSACGGGALAPIDSRDSGRGTASAAGPGRQALPPGGFHIVRPGETLSKIAARHGLDWRELARWNGIRDVDTIHVGARLRLTPPGSSEPAAARGEAAAPSAQGARAVTPATAAAAPSAASRAPSGDIRWQWPTRGRVVQGDSLVDRKGVNIAGDFGQPVVAAAAGKVVYSGSGLIGYGQLIILKHDEVFLSAYANNSRLVVAEGEVVDAGQKIAEMGAGSQDQVMLHFEIRRNGQPVDPLHYLPASP